MTLRYVTGQARALVRGGAVVLLPEPVEAQLVDQVWDQLGTEPGVVEVLQVLTGAFGSSLRTLPPFAVAVVAGRRVHVAVRGALAVTLEVESGERVHVDGDDVTTWSERVVEDVVVDHLRVLGDLHDETVERTPAEQDPLAERGVEQQFRAGVDGQEGRRRQIVERRERVEEGQLVEPAGQAGDVRVAEPGHRGPAVGEARQRLGPDQPAGADLDDGLQGHMRDRCVSYGRLDHDRHL